MLVELVYQGLMKFILATGGGICGMWYGVVCGVVWYGMVWYGVA